MIRKRSLKKEYLTIQENIRKETITAFLNLDISKLDSLIPVVEKSVKEIEPIFADIKGSKEEKYFVYYRHLLNAFYHLFNWADKLLNAKSGSNEHLTSCKTNLNQIDFVYFNYIPSFRNNLKRLCDFILSLKEVNEIKTAVELFLKISFPIIHTFDIKFHNEFPINLTNDKEEDKPNVYLISVRFMLDQEPWANPQILRPEEIYIIKGEITINQWPDGYDTLILDNSTTSSSDFFELNLPPIKYISTKKTYQINGNIVFKYPQHSFEQAISIRLLGYFKNETSTKIFPTIIGYDQLILKVLDSNSLPFPTGNRMMNEVVLNISNEIDKEIQNINKTEKKDFLELLSGVINYQGFCLQQGIYREQSKVSENTFRDNLIQHLVARNLGEYLSKEPQVAGGRVEINYKGIVAELKVENKISDRNKLFKKYGRQPVAYASGNMKQLSILCILDLTEKKNPPAPPQNNVKLLTPKVHGFEKTVPEYQSKIVMVILDGNTVKPSSYSK